MTPFSRSVASKEEQDEFWKLYDASNNKGGWLSYVTPGNVALTALAALAGKHLYNRLVGDSEAKSSK